MSDHLTRDGLENALSVARDIIVTAIKTSSYGGEKKKNGQEAKNAAIRSSGPIQQIHSIIEEAIYKKLLDLGISPEVWPPIGAKSPELKVTGLLKAKDQDICFTVDKHEEELITPGVEAGRIDPIGIRATNRALAIGVRSQLSSIEKNFDTLVERAFAETLNLRLRAPNITLGEVYLLPLNEFDDDALKNNNVGFKPKTINLQKFTKIFNAITDPEYRQDLSDLYKYNATMLIVADFSKKRVKVLWDEEDVKSVFGEEIAEQMTRLLPCNFIGEIAQSYEDALASTAP